MGHGDGSGEAGGEGRGRGGGKGGEKAALAVTCCLIIFVVIIALGMFGVNIAKIVMGAIYIDDCPMEKLIPIYLIVSGCTSFFMGFLQQLKPKEEDQDKPLKERINILSIIGLLAFLFSFAWLICGSVWIFGNYSDAIDGCDGAADCCNTKFIKFAFGVTILDWVLIGLIIIVGVVACSVMCCAICCIKN